MRLRMLIDLFMAILLVASFAYPFTENKYHEVNGILMSCLFLLHIALNRRWYPALLKGRYTFRRSLGTGVNAGLHAAMLVTVFVAVPISRTVFPFLGIAGRDALSQIHIAGASWLFVLASLHLGMHWDVILGIIRRTFKGAESHRPGAAAASRLIALAFALWGVRAALRRNIGPKLVMYYSFDFARAGDSVLQFILDYLSIMSLCVCSVHYTLKLGSAGKAPKQRVPSNL